MDMDGTNNNAYLYLPEHVGVFHIDSYVWKDLHVRYTFILLSFTGTSIVLCFYDNLQAEYLVFTILP